MDKGEWRRRPSGGEGTERGFQGTDLAVYTCLPNGFAWVLMTVSCESEPEARGLRNHGWHPAWYKTTSHYNKLTNCVNTFADCRARLGRLPGAPAAPTSSRKSGTLNANFTVILIFEYLERLILVRVRATTAAAAARV